MTTMLRCVALASLLFLVLCVSNLASAQQPSATLSDADAAALVSTLARGLEEHSLSRFLSAFDSARYPRFAMFSAEMDAFFGRYDEFRVHYQLGDLEQEDSAPDRAWIAVRMQMDAIPPGVGEAVRRNAVLRLEVARTGDHWRIVAFSPREFFS